MQGVVAFAKQVQNQQIKIKKKKDGKYNTNTTAAMMFRLVKS
jgi:hypothetical protein